MYKQTIPPIFDYGCIVLGDCDKQNALRLERLQNQAMRIVLSAHRKSCTRDMCSIIYVLSRLICSLFFLFIKNNIYYRNHGAVYKRYNVLINLWMHSVKLNRVT